MYNDKRGELVSFDQVEAEKEKNATT
jgi:hypothetical protein